MASAIPLQDTSPSSSDKVRGGGRCHGDAGSERLTSEIKVTFGVPGGAWVRPNPRHSPHTTQTSPQ